MKGPPHNLSSSRLSGLCTSLPDNFNEGVTDLLRAIDIAEAGADPELPTPKSEFHPVTLGADSFRTGEHYSARQFSAAWCRWSRLPPAQRHEEQARGRPGVTGRSARYNCASERYNSFFPIFHGFLWIVNHLARECVHVDTLYLIGTKMKKLHGFPWSSFGVPFQIVLRARSTAIHRLPVLWIRKFPNSYLGIPS